MHMIKLDLDQFAFVCVVTFIVVNFVIDVHEFLLIPFFKSYNIPRIIIYMSLSVSNIVSHVLLERFEHNL